MGDFLKTLFYVTLVLFFVAGTAYFAVSAYFMTKDIAQKSLTNPDILNDINKTITSYQKGLLASHLQIWSFTLVTLLLISGILGYYGGLCSCSNPILIVFTVIPLSASAMLLGALGFIIIAIVTVISALGGLIKATNAHIDAGLIRR